MKAPDIAFLVCCFRPNAGWLKTAIESALMQEKVTVEVLVVDDGSEDGVAQSVVEDCSDSRVRFFSKPNGGKSSAINFVLPHVRADVTAILDADDLCSPSRGIRLVEAFGRDDEILGVMSGHHLVIRGKSRASRCPRLTRYAAMRSLWNLAMPAHDPTLAFRTRVGLALRFDERLLIGQGMDFAFRLSEVGDIEVLEEDLYGYRVHSDSVTRSNLARRASFVRQVGTLAWERRGFVERIEVGQFEQSRDNNLHRHFVRAASSARERGCFWAAVRIGVESILHSPFEARYYVAMAVAVIPPAIRLFLTRP